MQSPSIESTDRATVITRWSVVTVSSLMAVLLYVDRTCVGVLQTYIAEDLSLTERDLGWFQSAFFWSYALAQVPSGWISDKWGMRVMLTTYILAWSLVTGLMGFAESLAALIALRLLCGLGQAGAYPTAAAILRAWVPTTQRGLASSIVALGGRAGGALAPILTAALIVGLLPWVLTTSSVTDRPDLFRDFDAFRAELQNRELPGGEIREWIASNCPHIYRSALNNSLIELLQHPPDGSPFPDRDGSKAFEANWRALQAAMPKSIRRVDSFGWRPVLMVYGLAGVLVAALVWVVVRDSPSRHPWCTGASTVAAAPPTAVRFPLRTILTDLSLWGSSLSQFFTNVGWIFVITSLPRYLETVHHVSLLEMGWLSSAPMLLGVVGMFLGGRWTDWATRRYGLLWGRRLPIVSTKVISGCGYLACAILPTLVPPETAPSWMPWVYVGFVCVVTLTTDLGVSAVWAYCQDVGGRFTGSILGWGNMWGNLGAAVAPVIYGYLLTMPAGGVPDLARWNMLFLFLAASMWVSCACGFLIDATRPLDREEAAQ
ncbi:MAG: MFS transporter [Planctomycetaceae bacterium]|nr:MFS transporter [Planctomycetaceae bacterium]